MTTKDEKNSIEKHQDVIRNKLVYDGFTSDIHISTYK